MSTELKMLFFAAIVATCAFFAQYDAEAPKALAYAFAAAVLVGWLSQEED